MEKYLLRPGKRAGIYLVGYFDDSAWVEDEAGSRGRPHEEHSLETIQAEQDAIAEREREQKPVSVAAFVLDPGLPPTRSAPSQYWRLNPLLPGPAPSLGTAVGAIGRSTRLRARYARAPMLPIFLQPRPDGRLWS